LICILIIFEAASLSLVIGVLYAMLANIMERDFRHQAEIRQVQTSMALNERLEFLLAKLHDIALNNSIRVSMMLGMRAQILNIMKSKYPFSSGAFFFVRQGGKSEFIPPLPLELSSLRSRLLNYTSYTEDSFVRFQRMENGHYIAIFYSPIKRRAEILGQAYLVYDFTSDKSFWTHLGLFTCASLLYLEKNRLRDLRNDNQELILEKPIEAYQAIVTNGKFLLPLKGFPRVYYCASTRPLEEDKMKLLALLLALCAGVFFLTLGVAFIIARRVGRPLERIANQALEISKRPISPCLDEMEVNYLEFQRLVRGFNELLGALVKAREKLRERARKKLKESEEKYRKTFEASPYSITISTLDDARFIDVNEAFCKLCGYSKEEVIGKRAVDLNLYANPKDRDVVYEIVKLEGEVTNIELVFRRKNGQAVIGLLSARRLRYNGQECMVALVTDITKQRKLQEERENLEAQLRQAQKMEAIGALAGGIAHDFRNILQAILGCSDLLALDLKEGDKGYEEVKEIQKAAQRGSELTHQLLTFSRKVRSKFRPLDINDEIRSAAKLLGRTLPKTIQIDMRLQEDIPKIEADPAQIEQVLLNLSINAKDAMPNGGKLILSTECVVLKEDLWKRSIRIRSGRYVVLGVSDTGQGIDNESMEHIFEPFYTTKGAGKGTGLGLAMVYGIVQNHRGYILCESETGKGTCFKIYMPVLEADLYDNKVFEKEIRRELRGKGETVLMVDDDRATLSIAAKGLSRFGYKVLKTHSGEEGLEIFARMRDEIDVVILDYMMPGVDGLSLLKKIRDMNPNAKVILSSGYPFGKNKVSEILGSVHGFLEKPFQIEDMLSSVREVIDQPIK